MLHRERMIDLGLEMLLEEYGEDAVKRAKAAVAAFEVEIPSWVFGTFGGGRFGDHMPPGAARTIEEKLDDAALVHRLTGATPRVATHVLWDFSADAREADFALAGEVATAARQRGLALGAVNPTCFLSGSHRGSLSAPESATRERYIRQTILGAQVAEELGNGLLTLWLPDGSLYPGQIELRDTYIRLRDSLDRIYRDLPEGVTMLIEYKVFEPGTYSTTIPDWGTAATLAHHLGPRAGVLVDLGHHHPGTNVEQIVAYLVAAGVPAAFHFNTRYAADDHHAVEPNLQTARIFYQLAAGGAIGPDPSASPWAFMIDQYSAREDRVMAILHSVDSLQHSLARAMLVDRKLLAHYQNDDEIILANRTANDALAHADVRPLLARVRTDRGLPRDPVLAYAASDDRRRIRAERD